MKIMEIDKEREKLEAEIYLYMKRGKQPTQGKMQGGEKESFSEKNAQADETPTKVKAKTTITAYEEY